MEESILSNHVWLRSPEPIKIKVEKNTKGYNFEISVSGDNIDDILAKIEVANAKLKATYGAVE